MARIAAAAFLALLACAAPAQGFDSCTFSGGTVTATLGSEDSGILVRSGNAINSDKGLCGAATVTNTDTNVINGDADAELVVIDLGGGPFAPGASAGGEDGSPEIEFDVNLAGGSADVDLEVRGTAGADHITAGLQGTFPLETSAINLNADEPDDGGRDVDVINDEIRQVRVNARGGADVLSARAADGVPASDFLAQLDGEDGPDDITSGQAEGGPGNDTLRSFPGDDLASFVYSSPGPVTVTLGDGTGGNWGGASNDGETPAGVDTFVGRPFLVVGSIFADVLTASSLYSRLNGRSGADTLNGGPNTDELTGAGGVDTLHGAGGDDILQGGTQGDFLYGEGDDDVLDGGYDADTEAGGEGDDTFREVSRVAGESNLPTGADDLSGGPGIDGVAYGSDFLSRSSPVTVDLDDAADDGAALEGDNVHSDIENIAGGLGGDTLTGDGDANVFTGLDGDDRFEARDGVADTLDCGDGNDTGQGDKVDTINANCEGIALPVEMPPDPPIAPPPDPPSTPPVTPPVVTPPPVITPPVAAPPKVAAILSLPSSRRCASRRKFTVRVRREIRGTVKRVQIFVNGRRVKSVTGRRIALPIDLRGLPKGKIKVRLRVELTDGRVATDTRTYRTCATKKRRGQFG